MKNIELNEQQEKLLKGVIVTDMEHFKSVMDKNTKKILQQILDKLNEE